MVLTMSQQVLLVTGSRFYPLARAAVVLRVLLPYIQKGYILRHGAGKPMLDSNRMPITGFDFLADRLWTAMGGTCDPMPADWDQHGKAAGPTRNKDMVEKEPIAEECIGFPWFGGNAKSSGTVGCMNLAYFAGIPTRYARVDGSLHAYTGATARALPDMWQRQPGADDLQAPLFE
jgi:hypothetical protein